MMGEPPKVTVTGPVVLVHPDDINLADAKALAAMHNTSVVGSRFVPRGSMFLANDANLSTRPGQADPS